MIYEINRKTTQHRLRWDLKNNFLSDKKQYRILK